MLLLCLALTKWPEFGHFAYTSCAPPCKNIVLVLLIMRLKRVHFWIHAYKYEKDATEVNGKQNGS